MNARRFAVSCLALALAACSGSRPSTGDATQHISGLVVKGAVANADVTAYKLDAALTRGSILGSTTTASDGTFNLSIPVYSGFVELVAVGGSYSDEAVGTPVQLTTELSAILPGSANDTQSTSITLSPVSTIARYLAKSDVQRNGTNASDAIAAAWTHVDSHFGSVNWRTIVPTNLSPANPITVTLSDQTKAGLILAGFSQLGRTLGQLSGYTPGTVVTAATITGAAAADATDGALDGTASGTTLVQGTQPLNAHTFRNALAFAIVDFVNSPRNKTQLTGDDVLSIASTISTDSDSYLFTTAGIPLSFTPATITFINPPTYVGSTATSLTMTATQPDVGVAAVRSQNLTTGASIDATFVTSVWTISNVPLVEGINLIKVWAVNAAGGGSIADGVSLSVTRDTNPPDPSLRANVRSYADERTLSLQDASIPPTYAVTTTKSDALAGVYKSATRSAWTSPPSATSLETTNPDNVPFVQIAVPVSAQEAPIASATYSISDGANTYTGNLLPWVSPSSTGTSSRYDVPLSANIVPSLATTTTTPVSLSLSASFTDAAGNTSGLVELATIPVYVVGPPLYIAEDTSYPTYNETHSAFPYTLANQQYSQLWNGASGNFVFNEVRLARYVLSNPSPFPVAVQASVTSPTNVVPWKTQETFTYWNQGAYHLRSGIFPYCGYINGAWSSAYNWTVDGFTLQDCDVFCTSITSWPSMACPSWFGEPDRAEPCGTEVKYAHTVGDSINKYTCGVFAFDAVSIATRDTSSANSLSASAFSPANPSANETSRPASAGAYLVVPAASGSAPGTLALYVTRPLAIPRVPALTWNKYTTNNRFEAEAQVVWQFEKSRYATGLSSSAAYEAEYQPFIGAGYVRNAWETFAGSLVVNTHSLAGGAPTGIDNTSFFTSFTRTITH